MSYLFCFGAGYVALRLAAAVRGHGWTVAGTYRDEAKRAELERSGLTPVFFDGAAPVAAGALDGATHVLLSVPPGEAGDPVFAHHSDRLATSTSLQWLGYLSATSVYGDSGGAPVDEGAPLNAETGRGQRRIAAERDWLALQADRSVPVHVFRLAGIYGPGRSALDQLRAGTARRIAAPGHLFSRIHVDDIVAVLRASMARPRPGGVYNLCDDEPAESAAVIDYAAGLLGIAPPPLVGLEDADLSPMARSFYRDRRIVDNARIKEELGVVVRYPDYRQGLRSILSAESS